MKFRFLGTGTSVGVPQIGCDCPVCTSTDPRDKRRRCGAYVVSGEAAFLIDTPPELRLACVEYGVTKVDAVILTHAHMDHIAAFDDVRRFNTINGEIVPCSPDEPGANGRTFRVIGRPLPVYALPETIEQMHRIFPYISAKGGENGLFRPQIDFIDNTAPFRIGSAMIESLRVSHGFPCCGYLIREDSSIETPPQSLSTNHQSLSTNHQALSTKHYALGTRLGYISDCHEISDEVIEKLKGVDVMVLNCLREREHPTHLSLARAREYLTRIAPKKAYLIHMCHDFSHREYLEKLAGTNIEPAYDGLEIEL